MKGYPHIYQTSARAEPTGSVRVSSPGLEDFASTAPPEFGGPEGNWSPETLLVASVADCFVLTFRAIAKASKFEWYELECDVQGKLENHKGVTRFTFFGFDVKLLVPAEAMKSKAERLLRMAENNCLITNSLIAEIHLDLKVEKVADP